MSNEAASVGGLFHFKPRVTDPFNFRRPLDAAVMDRLDCVSNLDQLAGSGIGNRARRSLAWSTFTASRGAPASIRAEAMIVLLKLAI